MDRPRIGVIGVGHLGSLHAKMLAEIPAVVFAGVYDIDMQKASRIAAEFRTKFFTSADALFQEVDAVTIVTPTVTHFQLAYDALGAGKHVFVEKPVTDEPAQAAELARRATANGLVAQVGHIERFNPAILSLDKLTISPMFVESHRLAQFNPRGTDVAVVLDLMIHDIDIILSFVRSPVSRIDANGVAVVSDTVDIANARIQFENGCVANVTASRISQRKMRKMRMFQPDEYISIDFSEGLAEVFRLVGEDEPDVKGTMMLGELETGKLKRKIVYEQPEVRDVNPLKYELEMFVQSIRTGEPPVVTVEEARRALEVARIIMEKIGQQVLPQ